MFASVRERLGVPDFLRAPTTKADLLHCIRTPRSKTRLKEPVPQRDPFFDPYKEPMKWKRELEERGIESEIKTPRKAGHNPVLVYSIH